MTHELLDITTTIATFVWKDQAACSGQQELFFSDHKQSVVQQAKRVCGVCAVQSECLEYALGNMEFGVWGGRTANERRMMLRDERKVTLSKK